MLLLVLVAVAPPSVIALMIALDERDEARRHAQSEVLYTTRLVAADVGRVVEATATVLGAIAQDLAAPRSRAECERLLGLLTRASDRYTAVGVASANGHVYCDAHRPGAARALEPVEVSGSTWFREAQRTRGFALGDVGTGPFSRTASLLTSHAIPSPAGRRPRILFAALDVSQLADTTALSDAPKGTSFVVLDHRGTVVARAPRDERLIGSRLPDRPLVETVLREHQGTAEVKGLDGVKRIHGFAPLGGRAGERLFIAAGQASERVFADPNADLRRYFLLAALGLLLALALSYVATKFLLQRWSSAVVESARRFGAGDLTARAPVPRNLGDLTHVAQALNTAAEDIERRQEEQARLLAELVAAEEETRRRIAADIHDDTAQAVAAVGLRMDALVADLDDGPARETAAKARRTLAEANRRLRRLLFELRPPALDEAGLAVALELFLTDAFGHDGLDWRVDNHLDGEPTPEMRAILYRVAQEALANVRKHADARFVEVLLERRGVGVAVRVRDDGDGFDLPAPDAPAEPGHIGLVTMRERAEAAGGRFALTSARGRGTTVEFWMPESNGDRPLG